MDNFFMLSGLGVGESGEVGRIITNDAKLKRRLLELGFIGGERVKILSKSSLGDVLLIEIMGYVVSIRKSVAERIQIKKD